MKRTVEGISIDDQVMCWNVLKCTVKNIYTSKANTPLYEIQGESGKCIMVKREEISLQ